MNRWWTGVALLAAALLPEIWMALLLYQRPLELLLFPWPSVLEDCELPLLVALLL